MKTGDESVLKQLSKSLEETSLRMEKAHKEKNYSEFDNSKKMLLRIQEKISEEIKNG